MTEVLRVERRRYPRIQRNFSLKVWAEDKTIVTHTKNISGNGLYCETDQYIPPMTKVAITLLLPSQRYGSKRMKKIEGQGVVVRSGLISGHKNGNSRKCYLAIFFSGFSEKNKEEINRYVQQHLSRRQSKTGGDHH